METRPIASATYGTPSPGRGIDVLRELDRTHEPMECREVRKRALKAGLERAAIHHPEDLVVEQRALGSDQRVVARERGMPREQRVSFVPDAPSVGFLHLF